MTVLVKLSATLRDHVPGYDPLTGLDLELGSVATAADLARRLGLPLEDIKIVMINGQNRPLEEALADGDRVAYFPPVGGG